MKYFLYVRKSTDDLEKQALSLSSQAEKAHELFPGLDIIELAPESASAFMPNNRPVFEDMLRRIDAGEAQGIVSWHPDRLSRNEIDAAALTYRIRKGVIQDLKFGSYTFDNSPEGMMMLQLSMSQSQYFSSKLSKDVKRGNDKKLKMGWKPGVAPAGYLNTPTLNKGEKIIVKDPERFEIVKKMWGLMLTGIYSVPEVLDIANHDWGYLSRRTRLTGGAPLSRSALYGMFTNPFYAGKILYNGRYYEGKHEPMISLAEFDRVQSLLGKDGRPRPQKHSFAFRGLMTCGECGCSVTAETKLKYLRLTGETKSYTYYHCTRKRPCSQRKSLSEQAVIQQVDEELRKFTILPEFRDWAIKALREKHKNEVSTRETIHRSQAKTVLELQRQVDNLTYMRLKDMVSDEEYAEKRQNLVQLLNQAKESLHDTEERGQKWLELTEETFDFAATARKVFETGTDDEKRRVFAGIGGTARLMDQKLEIETNPWFAPIQEKYPQLERAFKGVRTEKTATSLEKMAAIKSQWLPGPDSNRQP